MVHRCEQACAAHRGRQPGLAPGMALQIISTRGPIDRTTPRQRTIPRIMPRVLISTITPISGGVPTMTRFVVATLRDRGYEPVLAHDEPDRRSPQRSVPSYRLGRQRVGSERRQALDDFHLSPFTCHLSPVTFHLSPFT